MEGLESLKVRPKDVDRRLRHHRHTILGSFTIPNRDLAILKVHILDPQPNALHQPQPGAIEEAGHQPVAPVKMRQDMSYLTLGKDDGQACRLLRALKIVHPLKVLLQDFAVQKDQRAQCLILSGGRDLLLDRQMIQELFHFARTHLLWVSLLMKEDVTLDPVNVSGFG